MRMKHILLDRDWQNSVLRKWQNSVLLVFANCLRQASWKREFRITDYPDETAVDIGSEASMFYSEILKA